MVMLTMEFVKEQYAYLHFGEQAEILSQDSPGNEGKEGPLFSFL